jgi:hypothetical protein
MSTFYHLVHLFHSLKITIFDVLGKQLSSETMNIDDLENTTFGNGLVTGVYQAVITQGDYTETIKIIKK